MQIVKGAESQRMFSLLPQITKKTLSMHRWWTCIFGFFEGGIKIKYLLCFSLLYVHILFPNTKIPPVYLHLIFEISSVTRFFFNFEISSLKNLKINLISKLIFAGYTGSKNQVWTWKKIEFDSKLIFFLVCNKLPNWHFKNQA